MANLKSSLKDVRRTARRTVRNQSRLTRIETAMRAVKTAASKEAAQASLRDAGALLDRAAHSRIIHWRAAARLKSRLALLVARKFPVAAK